MSTTVTYKGQTLTTVNNQTKTLETAGTFMEGNITLTDVTAAGASKMVEGTFTTGSTSGPSTLAIPYTGSGYPIALMVWPEGGGNNSEVSPWYSSVTRYAIGLYSMSKAVTTSAPTYTSSGANNQGCVWVVYKNSTSNATVYSRYSSMSINAFGSSNASNSVTTTFRFLSATRLSYYVIGTSNYGLLQGQTYHYLIIYSE